MKSERIKTSIHTPLHNPHQRPNKPYSSTMYQGTKPPLQQREKETKRCQEMEPNCTSITATQRNKRKKKENETARKLDSGSNHQWRKKQKGKWEIMRKDGQRFSTTKISKYKVGKLNKEEHSHTSSQPTWNALQPVKVHSRLSQFVHHSLDILLSGHNRGFALALSLRGGDAGDGQPLSTSTWLQGRTQLTGRLRKEVWLEVSGIVHVIFQDKEW